MKRTHVGLTLALALGLGLALAVFLLASGPVSAQGTTYYVNAVTGNDTAGVGSLGSPWQSISHAAANAPAGTAANPNTIQVAAGIYAATTVTEAFPIVLGNAHVELVGAGASTTIVDAESAATDIIQVRAAGVKIEGFTIQDSTGDGIDANAAGLTVASNKIYTVNQGIDMDVASTLVDGVAALEGVTVVSNTLDTITNDGVNLRYDFDQSGVSTVTVGSAVITGNRIAAGHDGIYVRYDAAPQSAADNSRLAVGDLSVLSNTVTAGGNGAQLDYYHLGRFIYSDTVVTVGNVAVAHNSFDSGDEGLYIEYQDLVWGSYNDASFTLGDTAITSNTITGTDGIYLKYYVLGYEMLDNSTAALGQTRIQGNEINATSGNGIYADYYDDVACDLNDNTQFSMGDITVTDNHIQATDIKVRLEYAVDENVGYHIVDNASARLPSYHLTGNTFDGDGDGVYLHTTDAGSYAEDSAEFDFGGFYADGNTFNGGAYGFHLEYVEFAESSSGNSASSIGDITLTGNRFNDPSSDAVYVEFSDLGEYLGGDATLDVGAVQVSGNVISGTMENGIHIAYDTYGSALTSTLTLGPVDISGNQIWGVTDAAIDLYYKLDANDKSTQTLGRALVQDNTISEPCDAGIYVTTDIDAETNATVTLPDTLVYSNTVLGCADGIYLTGGDNETNSARLANNVIGRSRANGVYVDIKESAWLAHNTIVSPTVGAGSGVHVVTGTVHVTDTIISGYTTGITNVNGTVSEDYTLFDVAGSDTGGVVTSGGNSLSGGDPAFADPGNDDYHLTSTSDALDAGADAGIYADRDGAPRPWGAGFDIGAYESGYSLGILKSVDDATPKPGQTITFTLVVTSSGLDTASGLVSDMLPAGLNFLGPIRLDPPGAGAAGSEPPVLASGLTIPAGGRVTVTFPVTVSYGLAAGTEIVNNAYVTATEIVTPVWASVTLTLQAPGVALSPDRSATAEPGAVVTYIHTLTNTGNIPDSFTITHASSQGWAVTYDTPLALGAGQTATLVVNVTVPSDAAAGTVDSTVVTARSQEDVGVSATAIDTTTVVISVWRVYLPAIMKNR